MRIGVAADHGGFELKETLAKQLRDAGHDVTDFGAHALDPADDYPDFVAPLAKAVGTGDVEKGIAVCGSGVGACIAANKVRGARACLVAEIFSAKQGVEDDDMNIACLGGRVIGPGLAWKLVETFVAAKYIGGGRFQRRLDKVIALEGSVE